MTTLEQIQWHHCKVFIANCEHISNFVLIVDFKLANICLFHIVNTNIFHILKTRSGIYCVMLIVKKIYKKIAFELILSQPFR